MANDVRGLNEAYQFQKIIRLLENLDDEQFARFMHGIDTARKNLPVREIPRKGVQITQPAYPGQGSYRTHLIGELTSLIKELPSEVLRRLLVDLTPNSSN